MFFQVLFKHPGWGRFSAHDATGILSALFQPLADAAHRTAGGISAADKKKAQESPKEKKYGPFFFPILKENF